MHMNARLQIPHRCLTLHFVLCVAAMSVCVLAAANVRAQGTLTINDPAEYNDYQNSIKQTDPKAKAEALEAFLLSYPNSVVGKSVLDILIDTYNALGESSNSAAAADRLLKIDPASMKAIYISVYVKKASCQKSSDAQICDEAAALAKRGLAAPKPADTTDDIWQNQIAATYPIYHSAIALDDVISRRDFNAAVSEYRTALTLYSPEATTTGPGLMDTLNLAEVYAKPEVSDLPMAVWFFARTWNLAPPAYKTQIEPKLEYYYKKYHGSLVGLDAVKTQAEAAIFPPATFAIQPAPTPAEQIHKVVAETADLSLLALEDKELVLAFGSQEDADKVWAILKDRFTTVPGMVIEATASVIKLAVTQDARVAKQPDFIVNLKTPLEDQDIPAPGFEFGLRSNGQAELDGVFGSYARVPATATSTQSAQIVLLDASIQSGKKSAARKAPVAATHAAAAAATARSMTQPIEPRANRGFASTISGASSASSATVPIPTNYALIFATDDYSSWPHLTNPIPDADALNQTLTSLYNFQVDEERNPTNEQILAKLTEYLHRTFKPQDQLLVFFSGHGYFDNDLGQGFIVPSNAPPVKNDLGHTRLLAHDTIMRYVDRIPSQHVVLIIDACFAGTLDRKIADSGLRGDPSLDIYSHASLPELLLRKEPKRTRRYFASGGKDFVPDGAPGHHSPFLAALLVTLNQAADRKGYVTLDDIQLGLNTVNPEPRWGDIQDENEPGADFILLTPGAVNQLNKPN
jgi:hypothetical protein